MNASPTKRRIIVALTGASGACYGVRLLQILAQTPNIETHLIVSIAAWRNIAIECRESPAEIEALADHVHAIDDVGACIASGSFRASGMVIAPCSMHTLASIAHGLADNLITRAADVTLKERRRLLLLVRESPLHLTHLRNMVSVTEAGAIVCPPMPAFYLRPTSLADIVDQGVARLLDLLEIEHSLASRWTGERQTRG